MLRLENAAMRYGQGPEVLRDVDLVVGRGDFYFVRGPTGAGKTSLLRVLGLIQPLSRGRMMLFERDVGAMRREELAALRRRIGMVFQDFRLLDHLSVFDNVALPLRIGGGEDEQIGSLVTKLLAWLGLAEVIDAKPPALSMGQRQLVSIARAVITRPSLLLCDEPTSHIDARLARRLMYLFAQLARLGTTVLIATHSEDLVERYPHPSLHIDQGRVSGPQPAPATMAAAD